MRILLDTHALLWFHEENAQLTETAKEIILSRDSERFVSYASLWEITIKSSKEKLDIGMGMAEFVEKKILKQGMSVLDLNVSHLEKLSTLPWHHRDPFDRLLVAQALTENLTLISGDKQLKSYPVKLLW